MKVNKISQRGRSKTVSGVKAGTAKPTSAPAAKYNCRTDYKKIKGSKNKGD